MLAVGSLLAVRLGGGTAAAAEGDFDGFLDQIRRDAVAEGIRPRTVDVAFRYIQYLPHVIELDRRQPEHKMTFPEYLRKVVTQQRLQDARQHLVENWGLLQRVRQYFHVQPQFVVALWGVESDFGNTMGSYSVPAALATLAYDGRRGRMFRAELIAALKILDRGDIRADNMVGSWAGAMGQCQFMPTTFLRYAVDLDGDRRRDIWNDRADVLGSIANYLAHLGWRGNEDWGREVYVPANLDPNLAGLDNRRSTVEWAQLGLRPVGTGFTGREPPASLVVPDGMNGTGFLVYDNFRAIKRWNNSTYFAAAVGYIADSIARG